MKPQQLLRGLYAITDSSLVQNDDIAHQVGEAIAGGARIVQFRDKSDHPKRRRIATRLLTLCQSYGALLIINDDLELAKQIGADGVHLGRDDATLRKARARLGPSAILGASCYNQLVLAQRAEAAGADYLAFGRFFPSRTKPDAVQADIDLLRQAKTVSRLPVVAIGGITPDNGRLLINAGADMLAVIHGLFGQPDIQAAAAGFSRLFQPEDPHS